MNIFERIHDAIIYDGILGGIEFGKLTTVNAYNRTKRAIDDALEPKANESTSETADKED